MSATRRQLTFVVLGVVLGIGVIITIAWLALRDDSSGGGTALEDFGETHVTVETPEGSVDWCMLLAETAAQRGRGLMQVTDPTLGGHEGMVFRFETDVTNRFHMRNTPMPLSIAFIAANGQVVSTTDMAPCEDRTGCPLYIATGPYRFAIETPQGELGRLGIEPGATVIDHARGC